MRITRKITSAALLCTIILLPFAFHHFTKTMSTGIYTSTELQLIKDNNDYVLKLEDRHLRLPQNLYKQFTLGAGSIYQITYSYGLFNVRGGKVEDVKNVGDIEG